MKKLCLLALAALIVCGALSGGAQAAEKPPKVKVMTRNLYLGSELLRSVAATTIPEFLAANAQNWSNVQQTDFPARAEALAREIADADPILIGLQEAELWYSGPFADPAPATDLEYDFLATLRGELAALGEPYDVVAAQENFQLEAPAGAPHNRDLRLVDQDAILVKRDSEVRLANPRSGLYENHVTITNGIGASFDITPGWVSVDVTLKGRSVRFVDTHLEPFHPGIRSLQAQELVAQGGPVGSAPGEVILVGDINSGPEQDVPDSLAFSALTGAGLVDTWASLNPDEAGPTCCFSELVDDPSPDGVFDRRIDHVLTSPGVGRVTSRRTGIDGDNRAAGGLWPSDHAGVVATLAP